jgi:AbrB family looped-hinge helix DNA binding protein
MSVSATIDSVGRIVLPSAIRKRLHLAPGSRLRLEVIAERIELTPELEPAPVLVSKGRRMVLPASGTPADAAAETRAEREAQAQRRTQR